jgi:hypothetical protein
MPGDKRRRCCSATAPVNLGRGLRWRVPCVGALSYEWVGDGRRDV